MQMTFFLNDQEFLCHSLENDRDYRIETMPTRMTMTSLQVVMAMIATAMIATNIVATPSLVTAMVAMASTVVTLLLFS